MRRWIWSSLAAIAVAGCTANAPLPGHNHPEGAAVQGDAPAAPADSVVWRLKVAGAT